MRGSAHRRGGDRPGRRRPSLLRRVGTARRVTANGFFPPLSESRWRTLRALGVAALRPGQHAGTWLLPYAARVDVPRLRAALVELHEAYDVAAGEVRSERLPTEQLLAVSHHAYEVLDGRRPVEDR